MSSKNSSSLASPPSPPPRRTPRSLRLRLILWYGALFSLALIFFVILVWNLLTDALNQGIDSSVRAEARITELALRPKLSTTAPYWPSTPLSLQVVNPYQEPGVVVNILDAAGNVLYDSDGAATRVLTISDESRRATLNGQTVWTTIMIGRERVRVQASPIYAPSLADTASTPEASRDKQGPVIGTLLVAKSLEDTDTTSLLLRTLLFFAGCVTLLGALFGGWIITGRVLQPLGEIARTARTIATETAHGTRIGDLSRRVKRPGGRDEMAQVIDTFNEMLANLEKATHAQRRFVNDASHELRAPLTTIQGNLAFLCRHIDELPEDERRTMLADAHAETLRLAQLVEQLLILARADANVDQVPLPPELATEESLSWRDRVELDRVVLQLVRQFRGRLRAEESALTLELGHIEPVRVRGNEESIRRILLILIDNALKYTPVNGDVQAARVIVSLERTTEEALLHVRDTGIGIEPTDLPHIFERFYRADRARSRQGTGLGLAIAKTLVDQLHGSITVESQPGQGSTFTVHLPLVG